MQAIEVIDSAVKIGLGALISGAATYFVTKLGHDRDLQKLALVRRLESMEQASENAERHFMAWERFAGTVAGLYLGRNPPNPDFSAGQWERIVERDKDLLDTREPFNRAIARLKLLGIAEAAESGSTFVLRLRELRKGFIFNRQTPTQEAFRLHRAQIGACIESFHRALSAEYIGGARAVRPRT